MFIPNKMLGYVSSYSELSYVLFIILDIAEVVWLHYIIILENTNNFCLFFVVFHLLCSPSLIH
mgnify:CR=1 FL=1